MLIVCKTGRALHHEAQRQAELRYTAEFQSNSSIPDASNTSDIPNSLGYNAIIHGEVTNADVAATLAMLEYLRSSLSGLLRPFRA